MFTGFWGARGGCRYVFGGSFSQSARAMCGRHCGQDGHVCFLGGLSGTGIAKSKVCCSASPWLLGGCTTHHPQRWGAPLLHIITTVVCGTWKCLPISGLKEQFTGKDCFLLLSVRCPVFSCLGQGLRFPYWFVKRLFCVLDINPIYEDIANNCSQNITSLQLCLKCFFFVMEMFFKFKKVNLIHLSLHYFYTLHLEESFPII